MKFISSNEKILDAGLCILVKNPDFSGIKKMGFYLYPVSSNPQGGVSLALYNGNRS